MNQTYLVRRDTPAWRMQTWFSFAVAVFACVTGLWWLPSNVDQIGLALGFFFCLFASFTLAKTIRDNRDEQVDTGQWMMIAWAGFAASVALIAYHLVRIDLDGWVRAYLLVSSLFLVSTAFTLSKTVRDQHEADLMESSARGETPLGAAPRIGAPITAEQT